ncbi:MAG: hypothetical protein HND52_10770 [Ignavibacteriae bacterium]|nr:hypothetical protein [Ignavibacteriota bacterium]NOG98430.1 hypothetical protein [Ignavibacteriota bacterium]
MKYKIPFLLFLFFTSTILAQDFGLKFFPEKKVFERHYADAISHQVSLSKHFESTEWFANIGVNIPVFDISLFKYEVQASASTTIFNTIIKTPGHIQVYTVDYLVDFYFDTKITEDLAARFIFGHLSAHFSDDGIVELGNSPISYVRDYIGLSGQYKINQLNGKIYFTGFYNFHNEPPRDKHSTFQVGFDAGHYFLKSLKGYFAFDLKVKSEVNNGTTQSFQAGVIFPSDQRFKFRFAYTHRRGFEERGQLYNQKDIKNSLGIYIDF